MSTIDLCDVTLLFGVLLEFEPQNILRVGISVAEYSEVRSCQITRIVFSANFALDGLSI